MSEELVRNKKRFNVAFPIRMHSINTGRSDSLEYSDDVGAAPIERSITHNISSTGCYFLLPHELPVGISIELEIDIPALQPIPRGLKIYCRAKVVRVEESAEGKVGIACTIDEYRFSRSRKSRTIDRAA